MDLARLSISLEPGLLERLDAMMTANGCANRSEFVRDLIRDRLVREAWAADAEVVGAILLVYNHHQRRLNEKLVERQHEVHHLVLATTHIHLDHDYCAETIILRGKAGDLRRLAERLRLERGVLHADLTMAAPGHALS